MTLRPTRVLGTEKCDLYLIYINTLHKEIRPASIIREREIESNLDKNCPVNHNKTSVPRIHRTKMEIFIKLNQLKGKNYINLFP